MDTQMPMMSWVMPVSTGHWLLLWTDLHTNTQSQCLGFIKKVPGMNFHQNVLRDSCLSNSPMGGGWHRPSLKVCLG